MSLLSSTGGSQWSTSLSGDAGSLPKHPESGAEDMSSTIRSGMRAVFVSIAITIL